MILLPMGDGIAKHMTGTTSCCGLLVATRCVAGSGAAAAELASQLCFGLLFLAPFGIGDLAAHDIEAQDKT